MGRFKAVAGAALVLGLLVLPPAISAGQDPAPADPGQAADGDPDPSSTPAGGDQGTPGEPGAPTGGARQDDSSPADAPADPGVEVQQASVNSTPAGAAKRGAAHFASSLTVSIGDNFYSPASISISVGDTVTWSNDGQASHSATASDGSFDTGIFGPGGSRSHTFTQAGTFNYYCLVHGTAQSGTVTVASAAGGGTGGAGGGGSSEAAAVASAGAAGDSSTLPLTGTNTLIPLGVGLVLLLAGLGLRLRDWIGPA